MRPVDRISRSSDLALGPPARPDLRPVRPASDIVGPSRSLVPVSPPQREPDRPSGRSSTFFLAHLIATNDKLPQTRARRRAEPGEAIAAYAAGLRVAPVSGHVLARVA